MNIIINGIIHIDGLEIIRRWDNYAYMVTTQQVHGVKRLRTKLEELSVWAVSPVPFILLVLEGKLKRFLNFSPLLYLDMKR